MGSSPDTQSSGSFSVLDGGLSLSLGLGAVSLMKASSMLLVCSNAERGRAFLPFGRAIATPPAAARCCSSRERGDSVKIVNGSSLQPRSGNPPRQIVILLHGYGASGADLISFAPHWQQDLPDALFLAPNAPQTLGARQYQWWPLTAFTPQAL